MANRRISRNKNFASYVNAINQDVNSLKNLSAGGSISAGAISGENLAENVTLFASTIQSTNYVPGAAGWAISGSGVAEFSNVYVRGDINAETGTIGYWNISPVDSTRHVGNSILHGTFLESNDVGLDDSQLTSGTYVSLFKSYTEDSRQTSHRRRVSNVAIITIPGHTYLPGDYISVTFTDADKSFNVDKALISEVSGDDIYYSNAGTDFPLPDAITGIAPSSEYLGTTQYVADDVAGLYLNDYSNVEFDYGYLSNKGLAYVSAPEVNFIYNPSFEYVPVYGKRVGNVASWATSSLSTTTAIQLSNSLDRGTYTAKIDAQSAYAVYHQWTTTAASGTYLTGTIDYSEIYNHKYTSDDLHMYFSFDAFLLHNPASSSTLATAATSTAANVTITVSTNPTTLGIAVDDYVYFGFTAASATDGVDKLTTSLTTTDASYGIAKVKGITASTIVIANPDSTVTGALVLGDKYNSDGTARTRRVFKLSAGMLDLSEIKINFGGGSSDVPLANVISADTAAAWSLSAINRFYSIISAGDYMARVTDTGVNGNSDSGNYSTVLPALSSPYAVKVDSGKLYSLYRQTNQTGLDARSSISIKIPLWVYALDPTTYLPIGGLASPTKLTSVSGATNSLVFDNFSFATSAMSFYGDFDQEISIGGGPVSISIASPGVITTTDAHGLTSGQQVYLTTTGSLPTGLSTETPYYVYLAPTSNTLTLTDSIGGSVINTSGTQSGAHTLYLSVPDIRYSWSSPDSAPSSTTITTYGTNWVNLNLSSGGSYILDGVDAIGFSNKLFQKNVFASANINTYMGYDLNDAAPSAAIFKSKDYHYLNISSATIDMVDQIPTYFTGPSKSNVYTRSRSYINTLSSPKSSGVEMAAVYEFLDENKILIDPSQGIIKSSITTYVDEYTRAPRVDISGTINRIDADYVNAGVLRIPTGVDVSSTSVGHPVQIGDSGALNMRFDTNEIEVLNNGAGASLNLNINGSGTVVFGGLLDSNDTYNNDITTTRHAMWISSAGVMGWASSSRTKKQDIVPAEINVNAVLSIEPKLFRYIKAVESLGDNAPIEVGMIAEDLHEAGLNHFVDYTDDGVVQGIHYSTYVVALQAVVRDQAARIAEIEKRLGI